jgi:hypothetical protein
MALAKSPAHLDHPTRELEMDSRSARDFLDALAALKLLDRAKPT